MNHLRKIVQRLPKTYQNLLNSAGATHIHVHKHTETISTEEYVPVYKFPYALQVSLLNRLKIYQTAATGIMVPVTLGLFGLNIVEFETFYATCIVGISGTITLFVLGKILDKFVGFVYVHQKDENLVRFAYVDFWGKRKDIDIPLEDLVPISEAPTSATDFLFINIYQYSTKDVLKINLKLGTILNQTHFDRIFPLY